MSLMTPPFKQKGRLKFWCDQGCCVLLSVNTPSLTFMYICKISSLLFKCLTRCLVYIPFLPPLLSPSNATLLGAQANPINVWQFSSHFGTTNPPLSARVAVATDLQASKKMTLRQQRPVFFIIAVCTISN